MLKGIDISNWQGGLDLTALRGVDFAIMKATEGTSFVDPYCDPWVQQADGMDMLWGSTISQEAPPLRRKRGSSSRTPATTSGAVSPSWTGKPVRAWNG